MLSAKDVDGRGKIIKLEMYEMESPIAAYGIFSIKIGEEGKALAIGQEGPHRGLFPQLLERQTAGDADRQGCGGGDRARCCVLATGVTARIMQTGERPELSDLLLRDRLPFSRPKYFRGAIELMHNYVFDRENIFRVREGLIRGAEGCRAKVFRYARDSQSAEAYEYTIAKLSAGTRFTNQTQLEKSVHHG